MSLDRCRTCRYVGYCTFPKNASIMECDEYEDMEVPFHKFEEDLSLQDLIKLWWDQGNVDYEQE